MSITGGGGTGATATIRIANNSIEGINKFNVMENWGDPYLGTFAVPNTIVKRLLVTHLYMDQTHPMLVTLHLV